MIPYPQMYIDFFTASAVPSALLETYLKRKGTCFSLSPFTSKRSVESRFSIKKHCQPYREPHLLPGESFPRLRLTIVTYVYQHLHKSPSSRRNPTQHPRSLNLPLIAPHSRGGIENIMRVVFCLYGAQALIIGAVERFLPVWLVGIALCSLIIVSGFFMR